MKRNFKIVSLLTVFTIVLNVLSVFVLLQPAAAASLTTVSDTMSSMVAGPSTHTFLLETPTGVEEDTDTITVTFPTAAWTGGGTQLTYTAVTVSMGTTSVANDHTYLVAAAPDVDTWGAVFVSGVLTLTAPTDIDSVNPIVTNDYVKVVVAGVTNDVAPVQYNVSIAGSFGDVGLVSFFIVDSDTVNVNGYINTSLTFDLDVGTVEGLYPSTVPSVTPSGFPGSQNQMVTDCAFDGIGACLTYGGGPAGTNYTVDLGELTITEVNKSGDSRNHLGTQGDINYIGFDLSTNAASGFTVSYVSTNGCLDGPSTGVCDGLDIPSVSDSDYMYPGVKGYGISMLRPPTYLNQGGVTGPEVRLGCDHSTGSIFCSVSQSTQTIYSSDGAIEAARGTIMIGASIDRIMPAGTCSDTLTFIATGTF